MDIGERERRAGSIPAHAGEPNEWQAKRTEGKVYPRPRGGTRLVA